MLKFLLQGQGLMTSFDPEAHTYSPESSATEWGNFPFANWNGIFWGLPLQLVQLMKIHFCPIWKLLCENGNLKRNFSKKVPYNPPMGCFPFTNYHFQTGVTIMGFAEDSGHRHYTEWMKVYFLSNIFFYPMNRKNIFYIWFGLRVYVNTFKVAIPSWKVSLWYKLNNSYPILST